MSSLALSLRSIYRYEVTDSPNWEIIAWISSKGKPLVDESFGPYGQDVDKYAALAHHSAPLDRALATGVTVHSSFPANDQAQPRRVSGVGWSDGLGGWLAAASDILCDLTQSLLVLLLHIHVEGHKPGGARAKAHRCIAASKMKTAFPALRVPLHTLVISSNTDIFDALLLSCALDCPLRGARLLSPRACAASPAGDQYLPRIVPVLVGDGIRDSEVEEHH